MKASPILICATGDMRYLQEQDRQVLRRVFTQELRGADRQHQQRLLRMVGDLLSLRAGEGMQLYRAQERSGPFHRYHRALLSSLYERQERFTREEMLHDWLKLRCWFVEWVAGCPTPKSTDYDTCSEDEIREFNAALKDLLHQHEVQHHFWPHLPQRLRDEQVEAILTAPERDQ